MRKMDTYIQTKKEIMCVNAYRLNNDMAAHKDIYGNKCWTIVDVNSGLYIKTGLKSLKECQNYALLNPDSEKITAAKKSERYKEYLEKMRNWKKENLF